MKPEEYLAYLEQGEPLILPSGLEITVRPVDTSILLGGEYTEELMQIVQYHVLGQKPKNKDGVEEDAPLLEQTKQMRQWCEVLAQSCVVSPKLVEGNADLKKGEFPIKKIATDDLYFLSSLINLPLVKLAAFCQKQKEAMERVLRGEDELPVTESLPGTEPDGAQPDAEPELSGDQPVVDMLPVQ